MAASNACVDLAPPEVDPDSNSNPNPPPNPDLWVHAARAALETQELISTLHAAALHYNTQGYFIRVPDETIEQWAQLARVRAEGAAVHADAALESGQCACDDSLVSTSPELELLRAYVHMVSDADSLTVTSLRAEAEGVFVRAATQGHAWGVRLCLSADAHIFQSSAFNSALICAARNGHAAIVRLLLCDGRANPSARCSECMRAALLRDHSATVDLLRLDGRAVPFEIAKTEFELNPIYWRTHYWRPFTDTCWRTMIRIMPIDERIAGICVHTNDGIEVDSRLELNGYAMTNLAHVHDLVISRWDVIRTCTSTTETELTKAKRTQMQASGVVDGAYAFDNSPRDVWQRSVNERMIDNVNLYLIVRAPQMRMLPRTVRVSIVYVRAA